MKQPRLRQVVNQRTPVVTPLKPAGEDMPLLDIVFFLSMRGQVFFASLNNTGRSDGFGASFMQSGNFDPNFPRFGPWSIFPSNDPLNLINQARLSPMQLTQGQTDGVYLYQPGNLTYPTPFNGPPIVYDYTTRWNGAWDVPAWAWNIPPRPDGLPVIGNGPWLPFTSPPLNANYDPLSVTNPTVMPAPNEIASQSVSGWSDAAGQQFGDKWPLKTATPSNPPLSSEYGTTVAEVVNFMKTSGVDAANLGSLAAITAMNSMFNDPVTYAVPNAGQWWQKFGYGQNNSAKAFYGYTMGPGYYGKTFHMWPPDPRTPSDNGSIAPPAAGESTGPGSAAVTRGYIPGDWRRRFFSASPSDLVNNSKYWESAGQWLGCGSQIGSGAPTGPQPNYTAVIQWILGGPQVFPPSLRNGRAVIYDSIPTSIPISGGTTDQVFWRNYIDYVLGTGSYMEQNYNYGRHRSNGWLNPQTSVTLTFGTTKITDPAGLQNPSPVTYLGTTVVQTMYYDDMPRHWRSTFWFGPLTLMHFLQNYVGGDGNGGGTWSPGDDHTTPLWQLKTAISQALADIKAVAPNSRVSMVFCSTVNALNQARVPLTRNFDSIRNIMRYPWTIGGQTPDQYLADETVQTYSWLVSGSGMVDNNPTGIIPACGGSGMVDAPLKVALNQLSQNPLAASGGGKGRTCKKLVIFFNTGTDGTLSGGTYHAPGVRNQGYYTSDSTIVFAGNVGTGDVTFLVPIIANMRDPVNGFGRDVQLHICIFGDYLEVGAPGTIVAFAKAEAGNLQAASGGKNPIEPWKLISGNYQNRIIKARAAIKRIVESMRV